MEIREPPYPDYREQGDFPIHDYRVVFWNHQLPTEGHSPDEMGWAELTIDVVDAQDVHEVIAWAERYLIAFADEFPGSEHTYCLYAMVPRETGLAHVGDAGVEMLHLAGADPTVDPESPHGTFLRRHPFDAQD